MEIKELEIFEPIKAGFTWIGDKKFQKLFLMLFGVSILTTIISILLLIGMVLFGITALIGIPLTSLAEVEELGFLSTIAVLPASTSIVGVIAMFVLLVLVGLAWIYLTTFFLGAKILEKYNIRTKFAKPTLFGFFEYIKLAIVESVTEFFNWVQPKILAIQIVLVVISLLLGVSVILQGIQGELGAELILPVIAAILMLAVFALFVFYNIVRFYICVPVRLVDAVGARDAMKKTWTMTRGYGFWIFVLIVLVAVISTLINLPFAVIEFISEIILAFVPSFTIGNLVISTALNSLLGVFLSFMTMFIIVNIYLQIKRKERGKEKRIKAKKG